MGFALERQKEILQERKIKGRYCKAAVSCWFTASGKSLPQMLKYQDEDGEIHKVSDIRIQWSDQKNYAGVLMRRYACKAEINGATREFTLLYHPEENTWDMVLPTD